MSGGPSISSAVTVSWSNRTDLLQTCQTHWLHSVYTTIFHSLKITHSGRAQREIPPHFWPVKTDFHIRSKCAHMFPSSQSRRSQRIQAVYIQGYSIITSLCSNLKGYFNQNDNSVIVYSPSCHSKPVWLSVEHKRWYFEERWGLNNIGSHLLLLHGQNKLRHFSKHFHRRKSYRFETTLGWVNNIIFIFSKLYL